MKKQILEEKCESCDTKIPPPKDENSKFNLCQLCKPWVLNSIYEVPEEFIGFSITEPELFKISLRLMEHFDKPTNDEEWYAYFCHIHQKKKMETKLDSHLFLKVKSDYLRRNFEDGDVLTQCNQILLFSQIKEILDVYSRKLRAIEEEKLRLIERGWKNYADRLIWDEIKPNSYELEGKIITTEEIISIIEMAYSIPGMSQTFSQWMIFDWVMNSDERPIIEVLAYFRELAEIFQECKIVKMPDSPVFLEHFFDLFCGSFGQNLQYLILASLYKWQRALRPSHHFLVRHRDVWRRSFQLLRNIIETLGPEKAKISKGKISIIGVLGHNYFIKPNVFKSELQHWLVTTSNDRHICIDILEEHKKLPIADQLCSVVLSLANDWIVAHEITTIVRSWSE